MSNTELLKQIVDRYELDAVTLARKAWVARPTAYAWLAGTRIVPTNVLELLLIKLAADDGLWADFEKLA